MLRQQTTQLHPDRLAGWCTRGFEGGPLGENPCLLDSTMCWHAHLLSTVTRHHHTTLSEQHTTDKFVKACQHLGSDKSGNHMPRHKTREKSCCAYMECSDVLVCVEVPRLHCLVSATGSQQVTRALKLKAEHTTRVGLCVWGGGRK